MRSLRKSRSRSLKKRRVLNNELEGGYWLIPTANVLVNAARDLYSDKTSLFYKYISDILRTQLRDNGTPFVSFTQALNKAKKTSKEKNESEWALLAKQFQNWQIELKSKLSETERRNVKNDERFLQEPTYGFGKTNYDFKHWKGPLLGPLKEKIIEQGPEGSSLYKYNGPFSKVTKGVYRVASKIGTISGPNSSRQRQKNLEIALARNEVTDCSMVTKKAKRIANLWFGEVPKDVCKILKDEDQIEEYNKEVLKHPSCNLPVCRTSETEKFFESKGKDSKQEFTTQQFDEFRNGNFNLISKSPSTKHFQNINPMRERRPFVTETGSLQEPIVVPRNTVAAPPKYLPPYIKYFKLMEIQIREADWDFLKQLLKFYKDPEGEPDETEIYHYHVTAALSYIQHFMITRQCENEVGLLYQYNWSTDTTFNFNPTKPALAKYIDLLTEASGEYKKDYNKHQITSAAAIILGNIYKTYMDKDYAKSRNMFEKLQTICKKLDDLRVFKTVTDRSQYCQYNKTIFYFFELASKGYRENR